MKSEERHQLLTNDLGVVTKNVAGAFEQHAATLIAVVVGVFVAFGIGFWWTRASESDVATAWTRLDTAQTLEDFGDIADRYKGKPAGQWALLFSSERILQTAMPLMFTNRDLAVQDIKKAREGFESLLAERNVLASIRERAMWGLALSLETTCDGDTAKPLKAYERLLAEFPDTMFKAVAEERLSALKNKDAAEFYTWFSKENPEPPEARPRDFKDGVSLPAPKDPASAKDMNEDLDDFIPKKSIEQDKPADKTSENPPATENKKEDSSDKPKAEQPAESEKPAGNDPPGGDKPGEKN